MKLHFRILPVVCLTLITIGLIRFPSDVSAGALEGLRLCGSAVIPALLPFFVLSRLFVALGSFPRNGKHAEAFMQAIFGVGGACLPALLISFIGGYPVGVSTVVSMYENGTICKRDAQRAIVFCNNSGPAFFVGIVGSTIFSDVQLGLALFVIHCAAALLAGSLTARAYTPLNVSIHLLPRENEGAASFAQIFLRAVSDSCAALLQISTLVIFFSAMLFLLRAAGILDMICIPLSKLLPLSRAELQALISGSVELSTGMLQLSSTLTGEQTFLLCAWILGWGGVCVHFQAMSLWQPAKLHPSGYFSQKILHGLLSVLLASAYLRRTPLHLCIVCVFVAAAVIFPFLRKKGASNLQRIAV